MVGRGYTSKRHDFEIASSPASREKVDLTKLQTSPGKKEFKFTCEDRERERERERRGTKMYLPMNTHVVFGHEYNGVCVGV